LSAESLAAAATAHPVQALRYAAKHLSAESLVAAAIAEPFDVAKYLTPQLLEKLQAMLAPPNKPKSPGM